MNFVLVAAVVGACWAVRCAVRAARRSSARERLGVPAATRHASFATREGVGVALLAVVVGWLVAAYAGAVVGGGCAIAVLRWRSRRANRVPAAVAQERFADAIASLAAAVRAGASLPQAIGYAAGEAEVPIRAAMEALVGDLDVGVPIEQALEAWRVATPGPDTDLVVGALELHRRSGGDLPAVLDQVISSIRARVSVAREVRSLTAQARLSAWILGLLPVGFFAFLWVTARSDVQGALGTSIGVVCVVLGLVLEGGAILWIRSLIRVV